MHNWQIKDLQGVGDVELSLDDNKRVFVLFGSNGVGKTKTLESLFTFLLEKNYQSIAETMVESSALNTHSKNYTNQLAKFVQYNDKAIYFQKINLQTVLDSRNHLTHPLVFLSINHRNYTKNKNMRDYRPANGASYISMKQREVEFFEDFLSHFSVGYTDKDIHLWFIEKAQSVNPYQKSTNNHKTSIESVLDALHKMDNRIAKKLSIDDNDVFLTISGQERELSELSSGFISIVKIIQSIISSYSAFTNSTDLLNVKGVVLIDEIESHLHVEWQTKIIPTLKNLFPNTTFYIATHSPLVLSQLEEGEAYLLKRDENGVVRSQMVDSPNKRILANVLRDTFGIDLNQLKRQSMETSDQSQAKAKLLALLDDDEDEDEDDNNNGGTVARGNDE